MPRAFSRSLARILRLARQDQIQRAARPRQYPDRGFELRRVATYRDLPYGRLQFVQRVPQVGAGGAFGEVGERVAKSSAAFLQVRGALGREGHQPAAALLTGGDQALVLELGN